MRSDLTLAADPRTQAHFFAGGEDAVLLLHGFGGTPANMLPLAHALHTAGFSVQVPRLRGHGTTPQDMARAAWSQWLDDCIREAQILRKNYRRVYIAGLSMGGTLTLLLAQRGLADRAAVIAAPIRLQNRLAPYAGYLGTLVPYLRGRKKVRPGFLYAYSQGYPVTVVKKVPDLLTLIEQSRAGLAKVQCPLLVVQPMQDRTVAPVSAHIILDGVSSQEKAFLPLAKSVHICTLDVERETLFEAVCAFFRAQESAPKA